GGGRGDQLITHRTGEGKICQFGGGETGERHAEQLTTHCRPTSPPRSGPTSTRYSDPPMGEEAGTTTGFRPAPPRGSLCPVPSVWLAVARVRRAPVRVSTGDRANPVAPVSTVCAGPLSDGCPPGAAAHHL